MSFKIPDRRIHGTWDIKEFYINSNDSTDLLKSTYGLIMYFNVSDAGDDNKYNAVGITGDDYHIGIVGKWDFSDKKRKLLIEFWESSYENNIENLGPINMGITTEWEILRLSKDEFKFKTIYNNTEYQLVLEKWI
jgi:hypothetical protein